MHITKSYFNGNQIRLNIHSTDAAEIESWVNFFYNIGAYNVPFAEQRIETPLTEITMPRERLHSALHSYYEGKLMAERCEKKGKKYLPHSSNLPTNVEKQADEMVQNFLDNMPEEVYGKQCYKGIETCVDLNNKPKTTFDENVLKGEVTPNFGWHHIATPRNFSCYRPAPVED